MGNPEHLAKLKDVRMWNEWRHSHPHIRPNILGMSFKGMKLPGANLRDLTLPRADFQGANLIDADLRGSDLRKANLAGAWLSRANFTNANFSRAIFANAYLAQTTMIRSNLSYSDLTGADLEGAVLLGTNLRGSILTGCRVYGISAWDVELLEAVQSNLIITPRVGKHPLIEVDNLEIAQFIYLLLNNEKIRDVIDTIGRKAVLILGRFTQARKAVLDTIRDALRRRGYLPILFDFEKPTTRDLQETIVTLAGLSRFIIADISDPKSIPQELATIVPHLPSVPVHPLLQAGHKPWALFEHIQRYGWVLPVKVYENRSSLLAELEQSVITLAETKASAQAVK